MPKCLFASLMTIHFLQAESLKKFTNIAYNKPYDINPTRLIGALFQRDKNPQHTYSFWCSAFVGFALTKVEF